MSYCAHVLCHILWSCTNKDNSNRRFINFGKVAGCGSMWTTPTPLISYVPPDHFKIIAFGTWSELSAENRPKSGVSHAQTWQTCQARVCSQWEYVYSVTLYRPCRPLVSRTDRLIQNKAGPRHWSKTRIVAFLFTRYRVPGTTVPALLPLCAQVFISLTVCTLNALRDTSWTNRNKKLQILQFFILDILDNNSSTRQHILYQLFNLCIVQVHWTYLGCVLHPATKHRKDVSCYDDSGKEDSEFQGDR